MTATAPTSETIVGICCGCNQYPITLFLVPRAGHRYRCAYCFERETGVRHALSPLVANPPTLFDVAVAARAIVGRAKTAGVTIDDGNVVDLLADNITNASLDMIRGALVVAGLADEYPRAL